MKRKIRADTFAVWGRPGKAVLEHLSPANTRALKRYVDKVVKKCYRIAYDAGEMAGRRKGTE